MEKNEKNENKKMSTWGLVLLILSSIFGFANVTVAYDQMGYASIIWYAFAAIFFFLPAGLMFAEYGSAFSNEKGGIYSWLKASIGERLAFIGTFIWLSSWVIWMISVSCKMWIPFSNIIFGTDKTQTFKLFGIFNPMETVGILAIVFVIIATAFTTHGFDKISKVSTIGGYFSIALPALFVGASVIVWIINKGQLAEPVHGMSSFIKSPNPMFSSPIAVMSFVVYAVFAYAGMETTGGVVDRVKDAKKNFPKGVIIAAIIMAVIYSGSIFFVGITANWHAVLGKGSVNLGNITYVLCSNLGFVMAHALGASHEAAVTTGAWFARFAGLSMFVAYVGAFFVLIYSPIKSFIEGSDPRIWPKKLTQLNKHGMPAVAMWLQAAVVVVVVFCISFGGNGAQKFYLILTDMGNISSVFPYLFLIGAFPFFKRLAIAKPFEFYKNKTFTDIVVVVMLLILSLGIVFTVIEPILDKDYMTAFWTLSGPLVFGIVGWAMYEFGARKIKHSETK